MTGFERVDGHREVARGVPVDAVLALLDVISGHEPDATDPAEVLAGLDLAPSAVARIDTSVRHIRETGAHWRRRGRELAALFSSARELAELRDVDTLLRRLVRRAHDLMDTDITYLAEFHPDTGELRVITTLGVTAPAFRDLRVPPGVGITGLVVESRAPRWVRRYDETDDVRHDPRVDAAVAEEGLVSLLGVPLLAGTEVLGVLVGANRVEHAFAPEEIALLSAFADHAAIVLQTARLLGRARQANDGARHALAELARHVAEMEQANAVHEELTTIVLRGGTAAEVAEALGQALRCTVSLLDAELRSGGGRRDPADDVPAAVRAAVEDSRRSGRCVVLPPADGLHSAVVAVMAGATFFGALQLHGSAVAFGPAARRTAERSAQIGALLGLKHDAVADAEQRVRSDLLADLLSDDPARRHDLTARARARRVHLDRMRTVVVAAVAPDQRRTAVTAAGRVAGPHGLAGEYGGRLVVLAGTGDPGEVSRAVHDAVGRAVRVPVLAVGARLADGVADVRARFADAEAVLRMLPALGRPDSAVTADEYLPYTALFGPDADRIDAFVRATVGPLLDRAGRAGHLMETVVAYLECRLSPVATARALHLHKNTVLQRLQRVAELLGPDWQSPDRLFRIAVAARISTLRAGAT